MRVITQQEFGGPEVLTVVEAPAPRPLPTEVLVRVHAIGLNPWTRDCAAVSSHCSVRRRSSSAGTSAESSRRP